jgi:hypothetical protein
MTALQPDPAVLRFSLLDALGLADSDLSTSELRRQVEATHGPLTEIKQGSYHYLYLAEPLIWIPLRRQQPSTFIKME